MKANEAHKLASGGIIEGEYPKIIKAISSAVKAGKFECWYYETISDITRNRLKRDGYKIGATQFDRNEILTNISW